ncbi:MAG: hypothetical protein ABIP94_22195, partial [Planctomycetota bacterium]
MLLVALVCLVQACASVGVASFTHTAAKERTIDNEKVVAIPFDRAWDRLVRELASRFYVINNIDKESRLINASFSSDRPEEYVTGGSTERVYERNGVKERVVYDPAASSSFKTGWTWGDYNNLPVTGTWNRRASLEG